MNSIKYVLFDWSGTLVNDLEPVWKAVNLVLKDYKQSGIDLETFRNSFFLPAEDFYSIMGVNASWEEIQPKFKKYYMQLCNGLSKIFPDVIDTLKFLKSREIKMLVFSAQRQDLIEREAEFNKIKDFFEEINGNEWDKRKAMKTKIKELGLKKNEVLYVGDMNHDIQAAHAAGIKSVGVLTGYHTKKMLEAENPDYLIKKLSDLNKIIKH